MSRPTVCAVMKATILIPVRSSSPGETMEQLYTASKSEAEGILRNHLGDKFQVVGPVEFSHAVIKEI